MDYLLLFVGLALLLMGAEFLVDSSVAIAKRAKISNFIIGLTVVGMGTSAPELFVSVSAAISGHGDLALGNVVGSNICDILLILGVTVLIYPFAIQTGIHKHDIPFCIFTSVLLMLFASDRWLGQPQNTISRLDGTFFILVFAAYMGYTIFTKTKAPVGTETEADADADTQSRLEGHALLLLFVIAAASLAALVWGSNLFLESATRLARSWGISEAVISITVLAVGTSMPELITSVVAALKHNAALALGNVLGSCVFNILFILGVASLVKPMTICDVNIVDYLVMILAAVLTFVVTYTFKKKRFDRIEGAIFLLIYFAYTVYLLFR